MSTTRSLSLFAPPPREARAPRHAVPIATSEDMARRREVMVLFTCAATATRLKDWTLVDSPIVALRRILVELARAPSEVSVEVRPELSDDVEIRDESKPDQPRHLLALVHQGLNIAEARAALASLQAPAPKGSRR